MFCLVFFKLDEAPLFAVLHRYPDAVFMLQVMVDVDDKNEWKECIDIGGVRLPTGYFFGASAATGDLSGIYFRCFQTIWMNCWLSCLPSLQYKGTRWRCGAQRDIFLT